MSKQHLIWDLPLRLFHWFFVICIFLMWLTSELGTDYIDLHMQVGYITLGLVVFRLGWGFIGPKHARFSSFFPTPYKLKQYLKTAKAQSSQSKSPAGHNPLGAIMIFVMLATVMVQATTGLFIDDDISASGPYNPVVDGDTATLLNSIHHTLFDVILAAIAVHIIAVFYYKWKKKIDLITPMINGKKSEDQIEPSDAIKDSKIVLAIIWASIVAAGMYWLVVINAPPIELFYY